VQRSDAGRYKIEQLLSLVSTGRIRIPRFQRGLRWTSVDVEQLFDSIYKGFPIGTLLFWQRHADSGEVIIGPVTIHAPEAPDALWVVDGQQRITSLAAALLPASEHAFDPRFELTFDLASQRFARRRSADEPDTRIPIRSAFDLQKVLAWLREKNLPDVLQDRAFRLADRLRNYEIPAYIVSTQDEDSVRQIFDRTNTFGKRMTRAEVFHALHSAGASPARSDLRALADEVNSLGFGQFDDNTLLFSVLAQRHPDVLRDFHSEFASDEELGEALHRTRKAIERAMEFLQLDASIPHLSLVPYQYLTVGLVRFFGVHPEPSDAVRVLLRRWFWRAAVQGPVARLGSTGTLRSTTQAIVPTSAYESVENLLHLAGAVPRSPDLVRFRWNAADVRIAVAALSSFRPRDPTIGEEIPISETIELLGRESMVPFVSVRYSDLAKTAANRAFLAGDSPVRTGDVQLAFSRAQPDVLATHAIGRYSAELLADGDLEGFLSTRAKDLLDAMHSFVHARAEWERPTQPPIGQLLVDEDPDDE